MGEDEALDWRQLEPFGAVVRMDLRGEASQGQIARLRALFDRHHLLLFPDQSLSPGDQQRISGWFGPVSADKEAGLYQADSDMGELGGGELAYHSDLSCTPEPLLGISLHAIAVDHRSSPTRFVDAMAAARNLPPHVRARLEGLHVMNLWPLDLAERQRSANAPAGWPGTAHPLLKPHPRTGEAIVYANASHSDRIVELDAGESEGVVLDLFDRLYDPANRYEHHWRMGDFIVWDNLALQHARPANPPGVPRTLQRVEIGSASYQELMPPALMAAYGLQ